MVFRPTLMPSCAPASLLEEPAESNSASHLASQNLLSLAQHHRRQGNDGAALELLSTLLNDENLAEASQERAEHQAQAITGSGGLTSERVEFLAGHLVDQVMDPASLGAMMGAGLTYRAARFGLLRGAARWGLRGRSIGVASSLGAFALEATGFPLYHRFADQALGRAVDWSAEGLRHGIAGSFLMLGGLKLFGFGGHQLVRRWQAGRLLRGGLSERVLLSVIPQMAMYLGIVSGTRAEQWAGLAPEQNTGQLLVESLSTLIQFNGIGRLLARGTPGLLRQFEQDLEREHQRILTGNLHLSHAGASPIGPSGRNSGVWIPEEALGTHVFSVRNHPEAGGPGRGDPPSCSPLEAEGLRDYQREMLDQLIQDLQQGEHPWLGLASPMQTGKSFLIAPIIERARRVFGEELKVTVLTSARIITDQVMEDLVGSLGEEVGRFDGLDKAPQQVTVASVWSLRRHLEEFDPEGPQLLINDEAFSTQAPTFQKIYTHFGFGNTYQDGKTTVMIPRRGTGAVIGLSGTGQGLEGYHLSGNLNLYQAIRGGWVRHMWGEQLRIYEVETEETAIPGRERLISWKPTPENAKILAEQFGDRIRNEYSRSLLYVQTIQHGQLLSEAIREAFPGEPVYFVHSRMGERDFTRQLAEWREGGGPLISIRRLSRGFRGTGVGAVFHTYQTTSPELFAQRTGRAWGKAEPETPDLYVLETPWSNSPQFANLARALGYYHYPRRQISTRTIDPDLEEARRQREYEDEVRTTQGSLHVSVEGTPLLESWRENFQEILSQAGGIAFLSTRTGLHPNFLASLALGSLPVRLVHLRSLAPWLGGEARAEEIWVESWSEVARRISRGSHSLGGRDPEPLLNWHEAGGSSGGVQGDRAPQLDQVLRGIFPRVSGSRRAGKMPLREMDFQRLERHLRVYDQFTVIQEDPAGFSGQEGNSYGKARLALKREEITAVAWEGLWRRTANYFQKFRSDPLVAPHLEEIAEQRLEEMMGQYFARQGWERDLRSPEGRLQDQLRRLMVLRGPGDFFRHLKSYFGRDPGAPGMILGWLRGRGNWEVMGDHRWFRRDRFFHWAQETLLEGGLDREQAQALVAAGAFSLQGWSPVWRNSVEQLLYLTRYWSVTQEQAHLGNAIGENPVPRHSRLMLYLRGTRGPANLTSDFVSELESFYTNIGVEPSQWVPVLLEGLEEIRFGRSLDGNPLRRRVPSLARKEALSEIVRLAHQYPEHLPPEWNMADLTLFEPNNIPGVWDHVSQQFTLAAERRDNRYVFGEDPKFNREFYQWFNMLSPSGIKRIARMYRENSGDLSSRPVFQMDNFWNNFFAFAPHAGKMNQLMEGLMRVPLRLLPRMTTQHLNQFLLELSPKETQDISRVQYFLSILNTPGYRGNLSRIRIAVELLSRPEPQVLASTRNTLEKVFSYNSRTFSKAIRYKELSILVERAPELFERLLEYRKSRE